MTNAAHSPRRRSLPWKGIETTQKKPGDWEITPTGWRKVPVEVGHG